MEESADDDAFLRPHTANTTWTSSRRGSHSQYSTSPSRSIESHSPYDPSQYEDLAHPSFMIGDSDIPVEPPSVTSNASAPLSGFNRTSGRLLFPELDPALSPSTWSPGRRSGSLSRNASGSGLQQAEPYSFATSQQPSQLLTSRSNSILESHTYRQLFGPYDDRLQNTRSSSQTSTSQRYNASGARVVRPPSPSAFRLPLSSSSSTSSFVSHQATSSYPSSAYVDPTVLTSPGFPTDTSNFNSRPLTTGSRSGATRQRSTQNLGRTSRISSQPLPTSTVSPFSAFTPPTSNFDSPDLFGNPTLHASFTQNTRGHSTYPSTQPTPLSLFPELEQPGRRQSLGRRSSHSDLSGATPQINSSYGHGTLPVQPRRHPADPMSPPARRYGTATRANMRGLYTPESVDAAYPGEWGLAFR